MRKIFVQICQSLGLLPNLEVKVEHFQKYSPKLGRNVKVDVFLPKDFYLRPRATYSLLFLNDGQDMEAVALKEHLTTLMNNRSICRVIAVAVYANERRMIEYGVASTPDYKNRGSLANEYTRFITEELVLFVKDHYNLSQRINEMAIAGFSLGGLSAFDIAWHHANLFHKVGVFSGSFWWRSAPSNDIDPDADRIVPHILQFSHKKEGLKFWLQAGTEDEKDDRNNNGVIDAIDDTLSIMTELNKLGYNEKDIKYLEVNGGKHDTNTWRTAMPDFLSWAFGG